MNNHTSSRSGFVGKKLIAVFLSFLFLITPLTSVLAEEATPPPSSESVISTEGEPAAQPVIQESSSTENQQDLSAPIDNTQLPETDTEANDKKEKDKDKGDDPDVTPQAAMLNGIEAPGSPTLSSSSRAVTSFIDETTGALVYKYAISIPPGRNNATTPAIDLLYNSADARNDSVVGAGWSINIPYIERENKDGTDKLYTENYYSSSLSGELVSLGSSNYAAKVEKGDFLKYTKLTNGWKVTDKNGTAYTFGANAQARQDNTGDSSQIFKWMLEEVRDANDNYVSYTYYKDAGQIYPSQVVYTGNGSTAGVLEVNFDRASRSSAPAFYDTAFSVVSNYRISEIRTEVNNTWARKYTLSYTTADNGTGSLLDTIVEAGQDDSSTTTTLPAINFDYKTSTPNWTYTSSYNLPLPVFNANGLTDYGMRMGDINGDGLNDILCHNEKTSGECALGSPTIFFNTGSGWTNVSSTWLFPVKASGGSNREAFVNSSGQDTGLRLIDVNGDNLADLVRGDGNLSSNYTYLNTGSGWTYTSSWNLPMPVANGPQADYGMRMGDINGDGLNDILCHSDIVNGGCGLSNGQIRLNTGSGWGSASTTWSFPTKAYYHNPNEADTETFVGSSGQDTGLRLIDVNGDNLADLVKGDGNLSSNYVYLNTGSGWTYTSSWNLPMPVINSPNLNDYGMRMGDINGDGLNDILCHNELVNGGCNATGPEIHLHTGSGWGSASTTWSFPTKAFGSGNGSSTETFVSSTGQDIGLRLIDINGDNLADLVKGDGAAPANYVYLNNTSTQSNLLNKITYSQGGNTEITYKATPLFKSGSTLLNPTLPMSLDVVAQTTTNDGLGTAQTYTYEYEGGSYYYSTYLDRKFAGFNSVKETDTAGNVRKTYYHQGNSTNTSLGEYSDHVAKIGIPYRVEEYDNSTNLYRLTVNQIDRYSIGTDHDFVKNIHQTVLNYDGNSGHKDTTTEYAYDDADGSLLTKTEWGEVTGSTDGSFTDTGSDKRITTYTYATNTTTLVTVPYNETVTNASSVKVKENKYYYDTQSYGSVTKGNQTKVEQWVTGSTYINSQKSYNSTYGTVATQTDPRGKVTSYSYDSYNLYPTTVTDPLSQSVQYVYDYSLGKPKQTTDQNSFVYQTVYDGLDRVLTEKIPDFASPYSPVTKTAYAYTDTSGSVSVHRTDNLDSSIAVETYQYFDGLGRLIQERKEAESNYNVKDTVYNTVGLIQKQSLPYNNSGSSKTSATTTTSLYVAKTYDPLQRVLTIVDATGTTSYAYDDWKTTVTDKNSKVKKYYNDAYNNLIKVDEVNGASTYTTNYEWNLNGKLTKITDALSNLRNFTYDGLGRRLTAEDLHASGDSTFGSWTYTYDDAGNLTQTVNPRSLTTTYTYNDINQVLTENYTGASGTEISYTYGGCTNGIEKLCSIAMASGADTSYTYDSNGNTASEAKTINTVAYTTSYTYDRQGNKLTITYPDSAQVRYTFNTAGLLNQIERKESGGSFTDVISNFDYSPMDQITTQAYPNGLTTTNTYDATKLYRLTGRFTSNGTTGGGTAMKVLAVGGGGGGGGGNDNDAYNGAGGGAGGYQYETAHSVTTGTYSVTVGAGGVGSTNSSNKGSNGGDSIFDTITAIGGGGGGSRNNVNGANGASGGGASIKSTSGTGGTGSQGSNGGTATQGGTTNAGAGGGGASAAGGNVAGNSTTGGAGGAGTANSITGTSVTYAGGGGGSSSGAGGRGLGGSGGGGNGANYPGAGSAGTANTGGGGGGGSGDNNNGAGGPGGKGVVIISYVTADFGTCTATGTYTTTTSGANTIFTFTGNGTFTVVGGASAGLQNLTYAYDNVGNITRIVDASSTSSSKIADYVYDDLHRMTSATITSVASGQSTYTHTYTYDAIGNITSGPVGSYTYAGTSYANPHAATSINSVTNTYDASGNLTANGTLTNTWNYKDQLTQAVVSSVTSTYTYDQSGERASSSNGTTTTVYPNDFYNTNGTKKTKQIYAADRLVATIETVSSTVTPYYDHTDYLGSTNVVSDSTGAQVELLDYYPFGNQRISSGAYTGQRQYVGQIYDADTGLDYLNARYYNGTQGRFISQDPIFWNPEKFLNDPQQLNSYSYARNNPITLSDPTGKWYGELLAGKQSWSSFAGEVGEATQYMGNGWQTAMDHPYVPAMVGAAPLATYLAAPYAASIANTAAKALFNPQAIARGTINTAFNVGGQVMEDKMQGKQTSPGDYAKIVGASYLGGSLTPSNAGVKTSTAIAGLTNIATQISTGDHNINPMKLGGAMLGSSFGTWAASLAGKVSGIGAYTVQQYGLSKVGWVVESPLSIISSGFAKKKAR